MQTIEIEFKETELQPGDKPKLEHGPVKITEPTRFTHDGEVIGIYTSLADEKWSEGLRAMAQTTPIIKDTRLSGVATQSAVYGHLPAVHVRVSYCRLTRMSTTMPKYHHGVKECARYINELYRKHLPEAHEYNREMVEEQIDGQYTLEDSVFTTCNFNFNHAIPYHRDTGNLKNVYSNVIIYRKGIIGGELVFPEWGIHLEQADGFIGIFDGQKYLHGVTPVKKETEHAYRASIVFYALENMRNCLPPEEEIKQARQYRHKVESNFRNMK